MNRQALIHIIGSLALPAPSRQPLDRIMLDNKGCLYRGKHIGPCLECPLSQCQYEGPEQPVKHKAKQRPDCAHDWIVSEATCAGYAFGKPCRVHRARQPASWD